MGSENCQHRRKHPLNKNIESCITLTFMLYNIGLYFDLQKNHNYRCSLRLTGLKPLENSGSVSKMQWFTAR